MLVGREPERARIERLLAAARIGRGGSLVVVGEPGIGKTALLADAASRAEGIRVLRVRGVEAEADLLFAGLLELLRPLRRHLDVLADDQAQVLRGTLALGPRLEGKLLIGVATLALLSAAAEQEPLLCLVDDAHWLDVASAEVLLFVARRLEDDPIVFLFAARIGETRRFDAPAVDELKLAGLERDAGRELLARGGTVLAPAVADRLQEVVRGNPLALLELPHALAEEQRTGAQPLSEPLPVTEALQQAFARRIERLPAEARRALVVAAAEPSGRAASVERALLALRLEAAALEAAEDEGLLTLAHGQLSFRHPLIRAAAYYDASPSERRRAHRALAAAAAESRDRGGRAWHLAAAAAGADEEAGAALEVEGERAKAHGALVAAAAAFARAAALSPERERRAQRLCRAARAEARQRGSSAFARGRAIVAEALPLTDDRALAAELRYWEAFFEIELDTRRGHDLLLAEAEALARSDPKLAALLAAEAAFVALWFLEEADVLAASAAARALARRAPGTSDPYVTVLRALALIESGRLAAARPLSMAARELIDQILRVVAAGGDLTEDAFPVYRGPAVYRAVLVAAEPRQLHALAVLFDRMRSVWGPLGDGGVLLVTAYYRARIHYDAGRWDDARAGFGEAERLCAELGESQGSLWYPLANLAQLAAARGADDDCRSYSEAAGRVTSFGAPLHFTGFPGSGALGLLALGHSQYERAVEEYERSLLPRIGRLALCHELADAIEAYARSERREEARRWLLPFAAQAASSRWPWARARAAHLQGLLADDASFEDAFATALAFHAQAAQPFQQARTKLGYGERLRRKGLRRQAREHLREALRTFETLGAAPWAERAATELRATGEHVRRRTEPDTSELTAQELQIALVVARGATNKQAAAELFLSPKTIEKHLGSVYAKLGIHSRAELGAAFRSPATNA